MKKNILVLVGAIALIFTSCDNTKKGVRYAAVSNSEIERVAMYTTENEGYTLMKNNCYACHNPNTESHDAIIAPPFKAVKMQYSRKYNTKEEFVDAVVNWVQNPTEDKAIMKGAVNRFKVMPKLPLPTEDLEKIASYMYDNEVDQPKWMGQHMKDMKGKGMMKGNGIDKGQGCGMKNKKSCNHKKGESCGNGC